LSVSSHHVEIRHAQYIGTWGSSTQHKKKATLTVDEAASDPFAIPDVEWETTRFLRNLQRELIVATGDRAKETMEKLLFDFGRMLGKLEAEELELPTDERKRLSKSKFLLDRWKNRKMGF
jgi:hypothetical protein